MTEQRRLNKSMVWKAAINLAAFCYLVRALGIGHWAWVIENS